MPESLDPRSLKLLYGLARKLLFVDGYDETLDLVVGDALAITGGERGFLVLKRGAEGLDFKVVRNWKRRELEGSEPVSRSIVASVLEEGRPVLVEDALADPRFAEQESVLRRGIRSVLAAPLSVEGEAVGVLYLESQSPDRLLGPVELDRFERVLDLASRALETATRRVLLEERTALLERDLLARYDFPGIVTRDPGFLKVLKTAAQVASSELPVLVQGPSGTGKELVVRALHLNSRRRTGPLVTVNCGAIAPNLLESELFGHVEGAFTGATRDREGLLERADGGSLFLDEVGEIPLDLQPKLLRAIQFGEVQRVGESRTATVDVRFLVATNRDLEEEVREERFREDLLYRLNAITLDLPPLKDRPGDILLLFQHFLDEAAAADGRPVPRLTPEVETVLQRHGWPGNVRELANEARRLVALTPDGEAVTVDRLSRRITGDPGTTETPPTLQEAEAELIERHLAAADGNRTHAARSLGLSREGLRKKMKRHGIG